MFSLGVGTYFRPSPSRWFVAGGSVLLVVRLWKVRLVGVPQYSLVFILLRTLLASMCVDRSRDGMKP